MTIKLRFAFLLSLLLGAFLLAVFGLRRLERAEMTAMLGLERKARIQLLNHWIDVTSRALPQFTTDTAQSEELASLLEKFPPDLVRQKLAASLTAAGLGSLWLLRADGSVLLHAGADGTGGEAPAPLAAADFMSLVRETPAPRFFADSADGLIEVSLRRIQPPRTDGADWLAVARRWNPAQLLSLGHLTEAQVSLRAAHDFVQTESDGIRVELFRLLPDWQGRPIRVLHVVGQVIDLENTLRADRRQVLTFVIFGLLVLAAFSLALHQWVIWPLGLLSASLARNHPQAVAGLAKEKSELGRMAELVVASVAQRTELQNEIVRRTEAQQALERSETAVRRNLEERASLGRDLHDGVIQSLYAAGMGLVGIRAQLKPDQADAAGQLEQTREALNETIHDVRNFIIGLEPEALKLQTFAQAVGAMLATMRNLRAFSATVEIDEALAARLTLAQRVHALQITREAVSNALRHGHANAIQVALRPQGNRVAFEVVDDGSGFEAGAGETQGKGLVNFGQRALALGAELKVESQPGRGTRVRLIFSLITL